MPRRQLAADQAAAPWPGDASAPSPLRDGGGGSRRGAAAPAQPSDYVGLPIARAAPPAESGEPAGEPADERWVFGLVRSARFSVAGVLLFSVAWSVSPHASPELAELAWPALHAALAQHVTLMSDAGSAAAAAAASRLLSARGPARQRQRSVRAPSPEALSAEPEPRAKRPAVAPSPVGFVLLQARRSVLDSSSRRPRPRRVRGTQRAIGARVLSAFLAPVQPPPPPPPLPPPRRHRGRPRSFASARASLCRPCAPRWPR
jgi:hypothetical protein